VTTFRGNRDGDIEVEQDNAFQAPDAAAESGPTDIVIRGSSVVPPGADADSLEDDFGLPSAAGPQPENLPEVEPVSSEVFTISVLVDSDPSGARVFLDERAMGETPLRLSLDPLANHVLRFQHENCSDHVQFISAESWERGRSATISTRLDCP
jgi:hypothetical protein